LGQEELEKFFKEIEEAFRHSSKALGRMVITGLIVFFICLGVVLTTIIVLKNKLIGWGVFALVYIVFCWGIFKAVKFSQNDYGPRNVFHKMYKSQKNYFLSKGLNWSIESYPVGEGADYTELRLWLLYKYCNVEELAWVKEDLARSGKDMGTQNTLL